jgi:hypothetical protein
MQKLINQTSQKKITGQGSEMFRNVASQDSRYNVKWTDEEGNTI